MCVFNVMGTMSAPKTLALLRGNTNLFLSSVMAHSLSHTQVTIWNLHQNVIQTRSKKTVLYQVMKKKNDTLATNSIDFSFFFLLSIKISPRPVFNLSVHWTGPWMKSCFQHNMGTMFYHSGVRSNGL